ncbi:MAG: hypothetical protein EPO57_06620 [Chitinophagaceae bacterium]|nr:MAG: hypothetical protein EPO57_06620 [Chitinophagaceae bacterium]
MKKKLITSILFGLLLNSAVFAQYSFPIKEIYAYKQDNIPGILQKITDEKGNTIRTEHLPTYNYWFYIETDNLEEIEPVDLWISGKRFKAKCEKIATTPVTKLIYPANTLGDTTYLVPNTNNKIVLAYPIGLISDMATFRSRYLARIIKNSELVLGYYWRGKKYFARSKTIVLLEPDAHL